MNNRQYSKEQLDRLNRDKGFQRIIAEDQKLNELFSAPRTEEALTDLETGMSLTSVCCIAGLKFPAPTIGVMAMLELIGSPFADMRVAEAELMDVLRCLYLLSEREKALPEITEIKRLQLSVDRLKNECVKQPELLKIAMDFERRQARIWAAFDQRVIKFGETLGTLNLPETANTLFRYLSIAGGFDMLPDLQINKTDDVKKKTGVIRNGLPVLSLKYLKWLIIALSKLSGVFRGLKSAICLCFTSSDTECREYVRKLKTRKRWNA